MSAYLKQKGVNVKQGAESNRDALLASVSNGWYETEDKAQDAWTNVKDWIFDTWTDSELKEFADKHGIPGKLTPCEPICPLGHTDGCAVVPQPRKRDTLLQKVRSNYETVAKKAGETAAYPGNWLYETWSESEAKEWLDTHGFPAPQPSSVSIQTVVNVVSH